MTTLINTLISDETKQSFKSFKKQGLRIANSSVGATLSAAELTMCSTACAVETVKVISDKTITALPDNTEELHESIDNLLSIFTSK